MISCVLFRVPASDAMPLFHAMHGFLSMFWTRFYGFFAAGFVPAPVYFFCAAPAPDAASAPATNAAGTTAAPALADTVDPALAGTPAGTTAGAPASVYFFGAAPAPAPAPVFSGLLGAAVSRLPGVAAAFVSCVLGV